MSAIKFSMGDHLILLEVLNEIVDVSRETCNAVQRPRRIMRTETSEGETPRILDACPMVSG